jgi:5-amino-6-(5-phospho-D-ribitylamino)uracil phosphatase
MVDSAPPPRAACPTSGEPAPTVQALVCDVDGTLLAPIGTLPPRNVAAIHAACAAGVRFALATIRKRDTAGQIAAMLALHSALICEGGASIYDADGTLLRRVFLPGDVAHAIAALADERGFPLATTIDEVNYFGPGYEPGPLLGTANVAVARNRDALVEAPSRMVVRDEGAADLIRELFEDAPLHIVHHYRLDGTFIDAVITHATANKAHGVATLLKRWGLDWASTMAIGDAEADLDMIRLAGIGVAVANATAAIREVADFVTHAAADAGVASAIDRYVLSPAQHPS